MADKIVVKIPPYEGEYDFDLSNEPFSTMEWRWIKKIAGYLPLTIQAAFDGGDPDLFLAWAVIAMRRAGRITEADAYRVADELARAPFDGVGISFIGEQAEEDEEARPLAPPPDSETSASSEPSGNASSDNGAASPENVSPLRSGIPDSGTVSASDPVTSRP